MRLSITSVILFMAGILALALFTMNHFRKVSYPGGHNLALVLLRSKDSEGLKEAFADQGSPLLCSLRQRGVTFLQCNASSLWYPSVVASLLSGLYPSEHGLTRAHAHLSGEACTLAEKLNTCGFRTYASLGEESLLDSVNVMQGFTWVEKEDPRQTISAFLRFFNRLAPYRNFLGVVEVDLDSLGGPRCLTKIMDILYDGIGRERFLETGVLAVMVPEVPWTGKSEAFENCDPRMPLIMTGAPLKIGPGKCVLKPVSVCDMEALFYELALGQGFNIRDAVRIGTPVVTEAAAGMGCIRVGEVVQPPPLFFRSIRFDDNPYQYIVLPDGAVRIQKGEEGSITLDVNQTEMLCARYEAFLANRTMVQDWNITQAAGPILDESLSKRLGDPWNRSDLWGHPLHAVEHFRLAEALRDCGYPVLAINELKDALIMDKDFPGAFFTLAQIYVSLDPKGARKYYREFLDRYGDIPACTGMAAEARRFLGLEIPSK